MLNKLKNFFVALQKNNDTLPEEAEISPEDITPDDCFSSALNFESVKLHGCMDVQEGFIDGSHMTDEQLKYIPSDVISLYLEGANITDEGISTLPFLHNIKSLNLNSTLITDESIRAISKFITLEKLWIEDTKVSNNYVIDPLINLNFIAFGGNGESETHDYLSGNLGVIRT